MSAPTLEQYRGKVDAAMLEQYGINWADACGDEQPLLHAMEDGLTPEAFVEGWGTAYDLIPVDEWTGHHRHDPEGLKLHDQS